VPQNHLDRTSVEALYAREERALYNVVHRLVWTREDAFEIVQEAFVRLWQARDRVDGERARPYVYRIALNLARSHLRWQRVRALTKWSSPDAASGPSPEVSLEVEQALQRLRRALDDLPTRLRQVIILCELSNLSQREVAEVLAIPVGTVGSRRHTAMVRLRAALEDGEGEGRHAS
jgi:RNA polymerase sigma-70 factor (ECF subfamily)